MSNSKDPFVEFPAGATVFREGDAGDDMFIIESGQVDIVRKARGDEPVATLGAGDFFGEMAVLEDQPRFAGAIARSNVRMLRIERAAFADMLRQNVEIAVRIMRKLTARIRRAEQRIQELSAEPPRARAPASTAPPREAKPAAAAEGPKAMPAASAAVPPEAPVRAKPVPEAAAAARAEPAAGVVAAAPAAAATPALALRHVASGQIILLDAARDEFLVGRPDPVTGTQPEINLGPFDVSRTLSRRHAKILRDGGGFAVREEVGTTNGTFVNGERIRTGTAVALKPRDRLRFGAIEVDLVPV